jgi:ABC-type transport system involved in multi-copper enzyme maturation permease subunit
MLHGVALQMPYVIVFLAIGWWWFNRKDVLS